MVADRLPAPLARLVAPVMAVHERSRVAAIDQLAAGIAYFAFLALIPCCCSRRRSQASCSTMRTRSSRSQAR